MLYKKSITTCRIYINNRHASVFIALLDPCWIKTTTTTTTTNLSPNCCAVRCASVGLANTRTALSVRLDCLALEKGCCLQVSLVVGYILNLSVLDFCSYSLLFLHKFFKIT